MSGRPQKILIVDDSQDITVFLADRLEHIGFQVTVANSGPKALQQVAEEKPDLIILDIMMPEMDGYEVCRRLKFDPKTRRIPILMLTAKVQVQEKVRGFDAGADDYLTKPHDMDELLARIKALLKRSSVPPFAESSNNCTLSIVCRPDDRMHIRVHGNVVINEVSQNVLTVNPDIYARHGDNTPLLDWRFSSKQVGRQLYEQIFARHPELHGNHSRIVGAVKVERNLHVRFESDRNFLRVPLEFLFNSVNEEGDYFVLRHPLSRSIRSVVMQRSPVSPAFFNDLWQNEQQLKILLIGSNTQPNIPAVDHEIAALSKTMKNLFNKQGIAVEIKTIPTKQATYDKIRTTIQQDQYHVIHYAGHGVYDRQSPEKSHLLFWENRGKKGIVKQMEITELQMLLRNSDVRLIYLSCCLGVKTGEPAAFLDNDILGIAHGIVREGVPSVLGFRWPVSDNGAKTMALTFYKSLAEQGYVDTALLDARCKVAADNRDDITWLSPILIMQG